MFWEFLLLKEKKNKIKPYILMMELPPCPLLSWVESITAGVGPKIVLDIRSPSFLLSLWLTPSLGGNGDIN
jgi:hypothetical protein